MYNDRISVDFADESCNEMFISYSLCISDKIVIGFNNMDKHKHVFFVCYLSSINRSGCLSRLHWVELVLTILSLFDQPKMKTCDDFWRAGAIITSVYFSQWRAK